MLRVASTEAPPWFDPARGSESESFVTTLDERAVSSSVLGRVGGLGKGERIYAVRFAGDTGYVVTFRQVDPLYTLDLANPSRPAVLGELKVEGYSAYLHPIGGDLLLGIGQDATGEGRVLGTQLSLFDVSNLRRPSRLHRWTLGPSWSEAEIRPPRLPLLGPVAARRRAGFSQTTRGRSPARSGSASAAAGSPRSGRVTHRGEPEAGRVAGSRSAARSSSATGSTPSPTPA